MAGLSEAKIERNERLNDKKTEKQIIHFSKKLTQEFSNENVLFIGDSKIRHLYNESRNRTFLRMLWRSGAKIYDDYLSYKLTTDSVNLLSCCSGTSSNLLLSRSPSI